MNGVTRGGREIGESCLGHLVPGPDPDHAVLLHTGQGSDRCRGLDGGGHVLARAGCVVLPACQDRRTDEYTNNSTQEVVSKGGKNKYTEEQNQKEPVKNMRCMNCPDLGGNQSPSCADSEFSGCHIWVDMSNCGGTKEMQGRIGNRHFGQKATGCLRLSLEVLLGESTHHGTDTALFRQLVCQATADTLGVRTRPECSPPCRPVPGRSPTAH